MEETLGLFDKVWHLPLNWFGLKNIPAVPFQLAGLLDTILKRSERAKEALRARHSLTNPIRSTGRRRRANSSCMGRAKS